MLDRRSGFVVRGLPMKDKKGTHQGRSNRSRLNQDFEVQTTLRRR